MPIAIRDVEPKPARSLSPTRSSLPCRRLPRRPTHRCRRRTATQKPHEVSHSPTRPRRSRPRRRTTRRDLATSLPRSTDRSAADRAARQAAESDADAAGGDLRGPVAGGGQQAGRTDHAPGRTPPRRYSRQWTPVVPRPDRLRRRTVATRHRAQARSRHLRCARLNPRPPLAPQTLDQLPGPHGPKNLPGHRRRPPL